MISVEEALEHILPDIPTTSPERVQLADAPGRRLAEPVEAPWDAPRFDNSAMDGFAVRHADLESVPTTLPIAGSSGTGHPAERTVESGEAFRITTGAKVPDGADTVVPVELCDVSGDEVTFNRRPDNKGANIRRRANYLKAGEPALHEGMQLGGADIGLLASFGRSVISVYAKPRVGIISTGDELVELDQQPADGEIVNSNAYMLEALVESHGASARVYPIAPDNRDEIAATYRRAVSDCDLVLSTGGVSVGADDHVADVVDEISGGMTFWKVRMKPGKPLAFGAVDGEHGSVPLIGLPGNPAAGFTGFHLFARPALSVAQGADIETAPLARLKATLRGSARGSSSSRRTYVAGTTRPTGDGIAFEAVDHQSSGNPALFAGANAFGIIPRDVVELDDGEAIDIHLI